MEAPAALTVQMLDLSRQFTPLREEILQAIERVLDSQQFILGREVEGFEQEAATLCGARFAAGCASGTDALWLSLAGLGIGPGDAVITSSFSFFATVSSILRCGATPLLADIDPHTFNLCPASVRSTIEGSHGARPRAMLPVHLYGQCADWDALEEVGSEHELLLVEDAAQAIGATWRGRRAGSLGAAAAFSFYPTKNLSAAGDAGMVTTSSAAVDEHIRMLRTHGMRRRYFHDEVGWNARMDALQAAVLRVKLPHVQTWTERRRDVAAGYDRLLAEAGLSVTVEQMRQEGLGIVLPFTDERAGHVFHQYVIRAAHRDALREHLRERGIASEIYYPVPLHLQKSLVELGYRQGVLPHSEQAAAEVLALPIYPELRVEEQQAVVETIAGFYSR